MPKGSVSQELLEEVMTSFALTASRTKGVSPIEIYQSFSKDKCCYATVAHVAKILDQEGYLKSEWGSRNNRRAKFYFLTDKKFHFTPVLPIAKAKEEPTRVHNEGRMEILDILQPPTPSKANPTEPEFWMAELEPVIQSLQKLQQVIPALLAPLLDLSRDLGRLAKVKEILGGMKDLTRKNL